MSTESNQGLLDAALEVSARRAQTLRRIKELILEGDKDRAWGLLLQHLGIDESKTAKRSRLSLVKGK